MFRYHTFSLDTPGLGVPLVPDIVVYSQATDRYIAKTLVPPSVVIQLSSTTISSLPVDYDGFIVQRSDNGGATWGDVSTPVKDAFYYVDTPAPGTRMYRAHTRTTDGTLSANGGEQTVVVGAWGDLDEMGVQEVDVLAGTLGDRLNRVTAFPNGFDNQAPAGVSVGAGSIGGGYTDGSWYVRSREVEEPITISNVPVCGTIDITHPLTSITYTIRDLPFPAGGVGLDDTTLKIEFQSTSFSGGSKVTIYAIGGAQPYAGTIDVAVVNGADPLRERDITITLLASVAAPLDVVSVCTTMADLDGNVMNDVCSFTMEDVDLTPPVITNQDPECDLGITAGDTRRAARDTSYSFRITDDSSGVDLSTIDVFYGPSAGGPWTQVLDNGVTFLLGFTGSVVANGFNGFDVNINRPISDPLWTADSVVCFRVDVSDNEANATQDICCFKIAPLTTVERVIPLSETIIYVEFTEGLRNTNVLRDTKNWSIEPLFNKFQATGTTMTATATGVFTPGVDGVSNPTVTVTDNTTFVVGDLVRVSNTANNDDIFEVASYTGTGDGGDDGIIEIRSTSNGTTDQLETFTNGQFIAEANTAALIVKVVEVTSKNINSVFIRKVLPHNFSADVDPEIPNTRLGLGNPRYVRIETSPHTMWGKYRILPGDAIDDIYGSPIVVTNNNIYRGRRTKLDEALETAAGLGVEDAQSDSVTGNILTSIARQDDYIGGVYDDDDWD